MEMILFPTLMAAAGWSEAFMRRGSLRAAEQMLGAILDRYTRACNRSRRR